MKYFASILLSIISTSAELFVSSHDSSRVLRFDEATGAFIDAFVSNAIQRLQFPHGLAFGPDGNLYVASAGNDRVIRYDGRTGAYMDDFVAAGAGGLDYPVALIFRGDFLYVSSQLNNRILRFNAYTGAFLDVFVTERAELVGPSDMIFDGARLMVVGRFSNNVVQYDAASGAFVKVFSATGLSQPFGIRSALTNTNLPAVYLVASGNENTIKSADASTGAISGFLSAGAGGLNFPIGIVEGPEGNLYVASYGNDKIARFARNGTALGDFVAAASGGLDGPNFMIFRPPTVSISGTDGGLKIQWSALANSSFRLATSSSPRFESWEFAPEAVTNLNGTNEITVTGAGSQRFFRVQR